MGAAGSSVEIRKNLSQLTEGRVDPKDIEFWQALWEGPESALDVFHNIGPSDVRKLFREQPENLKTLIWQAVRQLSAFVNDPDHAFHASALNCVRFLTRIMPFLFEDMETDESVRMRVEEMFWREDGTSSSPDKNNEQDETADSGQTGETNPKANKVSENDSSENAEEQKQPAVPPEVEKSMKSCLAHQLLEATKRLLFIPGFTIDEHRFTKLCRPPPKSLNGEEHNTNNVDNVFDPGHLWNCGIGLHVDPVVGQYGANARLERNRNEVLKMMLTCFCQQLYINPRNHPVISDRWLRYFCGFTTSESDSRATRPSRLQGALFYSLMNVVLTYEPVGSGVLSLLPFAGTVMEDPREDHIDNCVHALLVLLDFAGTPPPLSTANATADHPSSARSFEQKQENASTAAEEYVESWPQNAFTEILCGVKNEKDFEVMFSGFSRLLNNIHEAQNTYVPSSIKQIRYHQELLILLWKCIDLNPLFREYCLAKTERATRLVLPCLFLMCKARKNPASAGQVHICTFILLHLSGDRTFGVALNRLLEVSLPLSDIPKLRVSRAQVITGQDVTSTRYANHADLMILVFHKVIVDGLKSLVPLYNCLLTVISNVSPYLKTLSLISSLKLVKLFEVFSTRRFLLSAENNHQYVFFLLDIFNNIIQYQYNGNSHLIYAMVRRKEKFDMLGALALSAEASSSASNNGNGVAERAAAHNANTSQFVATHAWLESWKSRLPLDTISRLLNHLKPKIEDMCRQVDGCVDEGIVVEFIRETTMVGLLPIPHAIIVRKYQPNKYTGLWFTTFLWGIIFMRQQAMPLWDGGKIKIFKIEQIEGDDSG